MIEDGKELTTAFQQGSARARLMKGFGAGALGQIINAASRVVLTPMFLHAWGVPAYGEWMLLTSLVAYLSLTDIGSQLYIVNQLTKAAVRKNTGLYKKILNTGLALFLVFPAAVVLLFVAFAMLVPPQAYLNISETSRIVATWVLLLLGMQVAISLPQGLLLGVYRSIGMLARGVMWANATAGLQLMLTAAALWIGAGMITIAVLQVVPYLLISAVVQGELRRTLKTEGMISVRHADMKLGVSFMRPSLHFFSIQLSQSLAIQGTVLVVGALHGSVQVVVFSILRTVANVGKQLLGLIVNTAWPELTRLDTEQDEKKLSALFRVTLRSSLAGAAILTIVFYYFGGEIIGFWLGGTVPYNRVLMMLFLIYMVQSVFWTACGNLLMAVDRHHTHSWVLLVSSILTVSLAWVGGRQFGLLGVVAGMLIADLVLPFWLAPYLLGHRWRKFGFAFFARELLPVTAAVGAALLTSWMGIFSVAVMLLWWYGCLKTDARG